MTESWRAVLPWLLGALLLVVGVLLVRSILLPFLLGLVVAYLLDPIADRLEALHLSRALAVTIITLSFVLLLVTFLLLLLPLLIAQFAELARELPNYLQALRERVLPLIERVSDDPRLSATALATDGLVQRVSERAIAFATTAVTGVLQSGLAMLNLLSLIFVTPVVAFYLLRDWDRMVAVLDDMVPPDKRPVCRRLAREIDDVLGGFLRGAALVCLLLGLFYAAGLWLAGLNYGVTIGLMTGLLSFIPYVGMALGLAVGLSVAAFQFQNLLMVAVVAGVFVAGQFIEGNFVTPRLVGSRIRLHPVWVIFAVLAGASLGGLVGAFLAVPVAAAAAVLVRYGVETYKSSRYFVGTPDGLGR